MLNVLGALLAAGVVYLLVFAWRKKQLEKKASIIAPGLSEKGRLALFAYQNYETSHQPAEITAELIPRGLIRPCTESNRYGITRLGKAVGESLKLYDQPGDVLVMK